MAQQIYLCTSIRTNDLEKSVQHRVMYLCVVSSINGRQKDIKGNNKIFSIKHIENGERLATKHGGS